MGFRFTALLGLIGLGMLSSSTDAWALSPGVTALSIPNRTDMVYDNTRKILYVTSGASLVRYDTVAKKCIGSGK